MLKIYHSNDLEVLKGILLSLMAQQPPAPFQPETLLVQSQGMAHWLKLQIADGLGVAAQLDFPLPSSFIWQVFNALEPELPERSHFDKALMTWKLFSLLPELAGQPGCEAIADYLKHDGSGLRNYQLSQTIADVFDQYLVYRPDWLLSWEAGQDQIEGADVGLHPWQPLVWRALVRRSEELGHSLQHRARIQQTLADQVDRFPSRLEQLPDRVFVFGIAALPGSYWQVLEAISGHVDVHYLLLNPCRNFWGDLPDVRRRARILQHSPESAVYLERGNPLLASWGKLEKEFLTRIHDNEYLLDIEAWVDPSQDSLLHCLQADIQLLEDRQQPAFSTAALTCSDFKPEVRPDDESIRIVSAHSALREVQRLHDQLLHWFDCDPNLKPRDIVVMVPDIDQYAPYIEAVFSSSGFSEQDRARRIPWAIADQSRRAENPLLQTYLDLLGLPTSRLLVTEVEDWLEVPAIRARFDIAESDLPLIKRWLSKANIRWGMDSQHRQHLGLSDFDQNSWRKGLRQLLLGFLSPDQSPGWCGDWPVVAVEGMQAELLGKLMTFVDCLADWQVRLSKSYGAAEWIDLLGQLADAFFAVPGNGTNAHSSDNRTAEAQSMETQLSVQLIRDAIINWNEDLSLSGWLESGQTTLLPVRVVQQQMTEQLTQQGGWQRFLAGPVNICTLMPMRSIPFRAVCMLGMNDADYPRPVSPVGFDLLQSGATRPGDRSRRDDDRFLFLEALVSAQEFFYVSYRGHSQQDNAELQPSVLVSELLDYLGDSYRLSGDAELPHDISRANMRDWLVETLPLQPFNPDVFQQAASGSDGAKARHVGGFQPLWAEVASSLSRASSRFQKSATEFVDTRLELPEELQAAVVDTRVETQVKNSSVQGETTEIHWHDVKRACRDSCQFFFQRRLKAKLDATEESIHTEEPFETDSLSAYGLKSRVLQHRLLFREMPAQDTPSFETKMIQQLQALGELPVGILGQEKARELMAEVEPLTEQLLKLELDKSTPKSLQLELAWTSEEWGKLAVTVTGESLQRVEQRLIRYRVGKIRGQDWLDYWMDLVFETAVCGSESARADTSERTGLPPLELLGLDGQGEACRVLAPESQQARLWVQQWIEFYLLNWCQPQPLLPSVLWAAVAASAPKGEDDVTPEARWDAASKSGLQDSFGALASAYWQRCFPGLEDHLGDNDWLSQHYEAYQWMLTPCFERLEAIEPDLETEGLA
ncbi:MAG: exodeoxyribonuclease V subunit gamma [Oceanobacter sp.]